MFWAARTMMRSTSVWPNLEGLGNHCKRHRDGDELLQFLHGGQRERERDGEGGEGGRVLTTSLPFAHTARRSYWLSDPLNNSECSNV